jgi:hypothetical protein
MLSKKLLSASQTDDILFVGVNNGSESSSVTGDEPLVTFGSSAISGVQSGDLLLVFISDDLSHTLSSLSSGWTEAYKSTGHSGTSTVAAYYKTATSSDTSFSIDGSVFNNSASSVMMAFRNASFGSASVSTVDLDDPPSVSTSSGDAVVIALHYQDDNFRAAPTDSDLPTSAGDSFRYITSNLSAGTLTWYNLSPSNPYDVGDITSGPSADLGAGTVVLNNS